MTAHETTNDCCRFTKGIISFPPEDWRTWLQGLLRINSNIWEDFWDSLLVNCYKQTLYMLGWLMKVILVIGYKLFTCPTGRCCCIVVVLSSLWNDLWLIVTGFSPQNCHQHLSSEMNQARKKLQRNITRILEPWLVSGDTLRAERRAPARVAKKNRKVSIGWPSQAMLAWCVVCVFGDVYVWRVIIFHWNVPNRPRGQDHAGGTPGLHAAAGTMWTARTRNAMIAISMDFCPILSINAFHTAAWQKGILHDFIICI